MDELHISPADPRGSPAKEQQAAGVGILLQIMMLVLSFVLGHVLRRHRFYYLPEASASLLIGLIVGGLANISNTENSIRAWFNFHEEFFFLFLLPPIIFQSGFSLQPKPFFSNFGAIVTFAIFGTFIASVVTGILVYLGGVTFLMYKLPFVECLMFGALISATDPVTVLSIFQVGVKLIRHLLNIPTEGSRVRILGDETTDPDIFEFNVKHSSQEKNSSGDVISPRQNPPTYFNGMKINKSGKHVSPRSINKSSCSSMNGDANQEIMFYESGMVKKKSSNSDETKGLNCSPEKNPVNKAKAAMHSHVDKPQKSAKCAANLSKCNAADSSISLQENTLVANREITRTMGLPKSVKLDHQHSEDRIKKQQKVQMLFPYEEFVKCFQLDVLNVSPRGLVNCGNSCYANSVLQCLTSTKPLIVYLLRKSHSRVGCDKAWCLMCDLEWHVMMLRESGYPLSPEKILMYIRSLNSQIGDGSQEDAHEFLRLIIASMQSICLERLGGENAVAPWLQNTTFVEHTFGGLLRSKVKCLRCHHESERHENIMDLTLEIFGCVESLEDALTQFTSSEDLDGDNMYRCGRCAAYVRARKQLSIMEAPNILTIVLKRFQEGNYGKINKCIRFPEMLDMIPFMTGTDDIPPLYVLYAVVVHLNTSNASFAGHYISYVKDLSGNWFKIDDTEVQSVGLDEVMSEGAYILFYARSYPRPARAYGGRVRSQQSHTMLKQCLSKLEKSSKSEQCQLRHNFRRRDPSLDHRGISLKGDRSRSPITSNCSEFSDATSSDWSLFTSSDDSSFTTESTRDSFSLFDYSDFPPFSMFQSIYPSSKPETRFAHEEKGYVSASYLTTPPSRDWRADRIQRVDILPTEHLYNTQKWTPT